jgi:omega-6 fatty acid desaturase (delta-12 desaturase)
MSTNTAIAILVAAMIRLIGFGPFLLVHLPITVLAASIGVWLFYVQHQFKDTSWSHDETWSFHEAAVHGSSHYHLPGVLRWFTANIGVHHIRHLSSRVPCCRLPNVLRDHPQLAAVRRITLLQSCGAYGWLCGMKSSGDSSRFEAAMGGRSRTRTGTPGLMLNCEREYP